MGSYGLFVVFKFISVCVCVLSVRNLLLGLVVNVRWVRTLWGAMLQQVSNPV